MPFTGDEAYFVFWGRHLDYGYYDHGGTTGWLLGLMQFLGDSSWLMRLPAVLISQAVGFILWRLLRPIDASKAALASALYLVSPINLINILTTTDTPLLLFSVLAVAYVFLGLRRQRASDWFWAGLFIGLAILSKYLAALLLCLVVCARGRRLALMLLGIVPGVAVNLAWNSTHGWPNILFNLITRNATANFSLTAPLSLIIVLAALAGPAILWLVVRRRQALRLHWRDLWPKARGAAGDAFLIALVLPITALFAVSFFRKVGAHWVLAYFPFLYAVLFSWLRADDLRRLIKPTLAYAMLPVLLALSIPFLPMSWLARQKQALNILVSLRPEAVAAALRPYLGSAVITTPSYSKSSLLAHFLGAAVPVIGHGSFHGRQDDFVTDFRLLDGRDIVIFTDNDFSAVSRLWFRQLDVLEHEIEGVRFQLLVGHGFNYQAYREHTLRPIAAEYYAMPEWLQRFSWGRGAFLERYDLGPYSRDSELTRH